MWNFVFSAQFITGLFVGANCALLAFALNKKKKKSSDMDYEEWIKNLPRGG